MPSIKHLLASLGLSSLAFPSQPSTSPKIPFTPFSFLPPLLTTNPTTNPLTSDPTTHPLTTAPQCPINGPLSCHNTTSAPDSCCFIYPGGQLLLTQFWDTRPSIGPEDSWTLHGLWPDLCDGRYEAFCHSAPHYSNITEILVSHNQTDLLATMLQYWLPNSGTAENFWMHEWNKHGTCINTLSPSCYSPSTSHSGLDSVADDGDGHGDGEEDYNPGQEVIDYLTRAMQLFQHLNTFAALASAGIHPSTSRTYTRQEISDALVQVTGASVVLGCQRGALNQAWYTFNVRGSLQTGAFVASEPAGSGKGTCPERGIRWWPKEE